MAFFHHGSIRKYTASILSFFNDMEIQYRLSTGETKSKAVPLVYSTREKSRIFDKHTTKQLLNGNYNVLPKANLSLISMVKSDARIMNKNNKINKFKGTDTIQFSYNSVPYEFIYDITVLCRGMNEATQLIEQIAPKFNPTVNIDVWDAENLCEPTRIPVRLMDVSIETEEYDELTTNIVSVIFSLSLVGNLYQPIRSLPRIKEFQMYINQIENADQATRKEMLSWDVDSKGRIVTGGVSIYDDGVLIAPPGQTADQVLDPDDVEGDTVDIFGYVSGTGTFDTEGNVDITVQPRIDIYFESLENTDIVYADGILTDYLLTSDLPRPLNKIAYITYGDEANDPLISLSYNANGKISRSDYYMDRTTFTLDGSGRNAYTDYQYNLDGKLVSSDFYEM